MDKLTELVSTIIWDVVKTAKKEGYSDDEAGELVKSTFDMTEYYTNNIQEKAISFTVNDNFTKIDENLEQKDQTPEAQIRRLERDKFQLKNKYQSKKSWNIIKGCNYNVNNYITSFGMGSSENTANYLKRWLRMSWSNRRTRRPIRKGKRIQS